MKGMVSNAYDLMTHSKKGAFWGNASWRSPANDVDTSQTGRANHNQLTSRLMTPAKFFKYVANIGTTCQRKALQW